MWVRVFKHHAREGPNRCIFWPVSASGVSDFPKAVSTINGIIHDDTLLSETLIFEEDVDSCLASPNYAGMQYAIQFTDALAQTSMNLEQTVLTQQMWNATGRRAIYPFQ